MDYPGFTAEGLPIGSGVTEAAYKSLVKQRLCASGMRWKNKGAGIVLSLRALTPTAGRWRSSGKRSINLGPNATVEYIILRPRQMASSLYRLFAQHLPESYGRATAKVLFDNLLDVSGRVDIEERRIIVTRDKRAHNPYLVDCGLADQPTPVPWLNDKELVIDFAQPGPRHL
jgi:hypothetical protein